MTRNRLGDLNNLLFEQLERLSDESLTKDELHQELERTRAIASVSNQIVQNAKLVLDAQKFAVEVNGRSNVDTPRMLEG